MIHDLLEVVAVGLEVVAVGIASVIMVLASMAAMCLVVYGFLSL